MADVASIIQDAATRNGVDPAILAQIAQVESGNDPNSASSSSSAKGLFNFTNPTWKAYGNGADPFDPAANADAGARLTRDNATGLASSGFDASPGNVYLAHFSGLGGARKVLSADPTAPVASVLGDDAVAANPFLKNMTVTDLRNWSDRKMSGAAAPARPTTGILNASSAPSPTGKPGMLNGGTPDATDEPDLTNVLAKALPPVGQQQVAALPPIRFVAPKGYDRAKFLAALTARKTA
jgi:Transglycosylase SLT domain